MKKCENCEKKPSFSCRTDDNKINGYYCSKNCFVEFHEDKNIYNKLEEFVYLDNDDDRMHQLILALTAHKRNLENDYIFANRR